MRRYLIGTLCVLSLVGMCTSARADVEEKKGEIKLEKFTFGDDEAKKNVVKAGKEVTFEVNAYLDEFFDDPIINANAKIVNKTDKTMEAMYMIVFMDKDGKTIGGHATTWTLDPNEEVNYGSGLVKGKVDDFKKVTQYRLYVTWYETIPDDF